MTTKRMKEYEPLITCETCGQPTDPAALSPLQCQECWEAQCSQSWWEMMETLNDRLYLAPKRGKP